MSTATPVAVHVAPHPDDEVLGGGATLLALKDAGWRVVNLTCSLGRPGDADRRRAELDRSLELMGIEGITMDPPLRLRGGDDVAAVARCVRQLVRELVPSVLLSPHPADGHHGHVTVGRGVETAIAGEGLAGSVTWWAWGLWAPLTQPNLYQPFGPEMVARLQTAMAAHQGENARNSYVDLIPARARVAAILGSEMVFGFGSSPASPLPYAQLLAEQRWIGGAWVPSPPRLLELPGAGVSRP